MGGYLPETVVTNADLAEFVDTSDEWIVERTGIHKRHRAADDEAVPIWPWAAARALKAAGRKAEEVDMIVVATTTPDLTFPSVASIVQRKLGAPVGVAFDVQAVCSGFVYAMSIADGFIARNMSKCALVIGAETMTRLMDWKDRGTCVLFGDGAGAVVLEPVERKRRPRRIAACLASRCVATGRSKTCSMWTADPPRPALSASCACREIRSSNTLWSISRRR